MSVKAFLRRRDRQRRLDEKGRKRAQDSYSTRVTSVVEKVLNTPDVSCQKTVPIVEDNSILFI